MNVMKSNKIGNNIKDKRKSVGFIQNDYHTEVLDFLFEILHDYNIVLYNDFDKYNNVEIYKKKYKNLVVAGTGSFLKDLVNRVHVKIIIVTCSLTIDTRLLKEYINDVIYITHSNGDKTKLLKSVPDARYFGLTHLLSENYMLPLLKHDNNNILSLSRYSEPTLADTIKKMKAYLKSTGFIPLASVGLFLKNNKDISVLEELFNKGYCLTVFSEGLTTDLQNFMTKYPNKVSLICKLSTSDIVLMINELNAMLILIPPKDSDFYKSQWSGSMAFGMNNDLKLCLSYDLAKIYNLQDYYSTYDESMNIKSGTGNIQKFRDDTYKRNCKVFMEMLNN